MRDGVEIRRAERKSRRLVSFLTFGVLLLAGWVFVTNVMFRDAAEPQANSQTTIASKTLPRELDTGLATAPKTGSLDQIGPEQTATAEPPAAADEKPIAELTNPVDVAAVMPSMGGTETLLSPTLVSRSVEPAPVVLNALVPLPPTRPRVASIPLPRPRPAFAEGRSGQAITNSEIFKPQTY